MRHNRRQQRDLDLLRPRADIWEASEATTSGTLLLGGKPTRYLAVSDATAGALRYLVDQPFGTTRLDLRRLFPSVEFGVLATYGVVDVVPMEPTRPSMSLVAELWLRNILASVSLRRHGWAAVANVMDEPGRARRVRPLLFDELEAAARISFALPWTSRQCTVVALTLHGALAARGVEAHVEVIGEARGVLMHSYAVAGGHIVDPGDVLLEAATFRRFPHGTAL